jgi:hypothetical protein
MKLSLKEAVKIIEDSSAAFVDGNLLIPHSDFQDEDDNIFLMLEYSDHEGLIFNIEAREGDNKEVGVKNNSLIFIDTTGTEFIFTPLVGLQWNVNLTYFNE